MHQHNARRKHHNNNACYYTSRRLSTRRVRPTQLYALSNSTTRLDSILDSIQHKTQHTNGAPATTSFGSHTTHRTPSFEHSQIQTHKSHSWKTSFSGKRPYSESGLHRHVALVHGRDPLHAKSGRGSLIRLTHT
ncbi:hypothetical protein F2Q69_00059656 [Brassica cretica]|uniref:Uncharacterized protein n=1 Tax=Brassica cretica TaxID=69181 RepID=A0A8S9RGR0_BRACR|nr:hypothetical protein F2Q69_00059656 [Brassica cretica]